MKKQNLLFLLIMFMTSGFSSADISTGLVAHYRFDDCSATDSSGNEHNGVIHGAPKCAAGVNGKGLQFNGTDTYIEINDTPDLRLSGTSYTLSGWVLPKSYNDSYMSALLSKRGNQNGDGYIWGITGNVDSSPIGRQRVQISGGVDPSAYSTKASKLNAWRHFVVVYEVETQVIKFYSNSVLNGTASNIPSPNPNTTASLRIARDSDDLNALGPYFFNGLIDDLRIYNRALTAGEIAELFNLGQSISGSIKGLQQVSVMCTNVTTGQIVTIPLQSGSSWNCKKAGLKIQPNQSINISIDGKTYP
ncbi:LamG domain-containing protein [Methylocucumis oryzae]|uniref:LamG-like jellyroll fold domain-containing protein n=1 Tax=Methylocucumis oryzae TaxID=1632867 RepID=A0A0F3IEN4_9GAMM|nr:LamG domain-containing protein [Methylocucumis oryzae]KJV05008.1 hypothetical protein VZ94_21245 [Methylocucumis oryzae]